LESLGWDSNLGIHDVKVVFETFNFPWIDSSWQYCKGNHAFIRTFNLACPVRVQCYDTGTVLVHVKSSIKPFSMAYEGLLALSNLLAEVKAKLNAPCVPEVLTWDVVQWHLNRDSERICGSTHNIHLSFKDFFGDTSQFYYKKELEKYRAEVVQKPDRTIKQVFEEILCRDVSLGRKPNASTEASFSD